MVSLPHTLLTRDYDWCAYTAKVRRFISMVDQAGNVPLVYGPDVYDETLPCASYTPIVFEADRQEWFDQPEWPIERVFDRWDANDPAWTVTNSRAVKAIAENWQEGDILGLIGGLCQEQIIRELQDQHGINPLTTEWGIGYSGVIEGTHKIFESYAWMHHVAARRPTDELHFFDDVIPNCFDPEDFILGEKTGDYLLYLGRPNPRKGLPIIAEIAKRSDVPLIVAGQPGADIPGASYVGVVTGKEKAALLAGARALLCPTTYLEPFGGVAVEAMMSGTPAIATDYGAFTETIVHAQTGFRCRMLRDFLEAVDEAADLDRVAIRDYAVAHYSTWRGTELYATYLDRLSALHRDGWYAGT